jgi:hypothetical protein
MITEGMKANRQGWRWQDWFRKDREKCSQSAAIK